MALSEQDAVSKSPAPEAVVPSAPRTRRQLILAAAMMAMFMTAVEGTIVAAAMPTIVADLGGFHLFSWVFAAYLLTSAVTTPIYGRLADVYGRKPVFFFGATLFLVSSTLCGFAWGMVPLVLFRALQGLGAGALQPIALTVVGDIYTPAERARVQGFLSGVWGVSSIIGPLLGAFIVAHLGWSLVFWVNLPVGAITMAMFAAFLPERAQARRNPIDYLGAVLLAAGAGAAMLALVQASSLATPVFTALLLGGLAALAAFIRHEGRISDPIMPLRLWRNRVVALGNLGGFGMGAMLMGVTAFLPTYVQGVLGYPAATAGLVLTALLAPWTIGSVVAGRIMVRSSYRVSGVLGSLVILAGSTFLVALGPAHGLALAITGAFLLGGGMGLTNTTFMIAIQSVVDWGQRGAATSSNIFMRVVGQAVGAAIFGAVLNWGIDRRAPETSDAVNRLMEPALRQSLGGAEIAHLTSAIAASLHEVYLLAGLFAIMTVGLTFSLPRGLSPVRAR